MLKQKRQFALPILLLAVSVLALAPTLTLAAQHPLTGTTTISASGEAFPIKGGRGNGSPSAASLTLNGAVDVQGRNQTKFRGLTGNLQIGSINYPLTGGQGEVNYKGQVQIQAKTSDSGHKLDLTLQGSISGSTIYFMLPQSKLASLYFLFLSGQITITTSTSSGSTSGVTETETVTQTITQTNNPTSTQNFTVTETVTQPSQSTTITSTFTETQTNNVTFTVTENKNQTLTQTQTATVTGTDHTTTETTTTTANEIITVTTTAETSSTI